MIHHAARHLHAKVILWYNYANTIRISAMKMEVKAKVAFAFALMLSASAFADAAAASLEAIETEILVVGGSEAACAAAVQAAREGAKVVLVNDIDRFGGQFSNEGVGPVDERVGIYSSSANFPRSGMALEIMNAIQDYNMRVYGKDRPGNCWSATDTIEPRAASEIFEDLLLPEVEAGRLAVYRRFEPEKVFRECDRVIGVRFRSMGSKGTLEVRARITIDASDFGNILRLGDVERFSGVDPRSRFGEPSEPEAVGDVERQEMNPITWTITLREQAEECPIAKPAGYDVRNYPGQNHPWPDSGLYYEAYQHGTSPTPYSQRRLVDGRHFRINGGKDVIQLNATIQDYPLCQLPPHVVEALERTETGASKKNICEMTQDQRRIVFDDAKRRSLGYLYFLQHDNPSTTNIMRRFLRTDEFGTSDKLPPKPYVREGMRLDALYVVREQDVRDFEKRGGWSDKWHDDTAFTFQFHIDFHPTRRAFVKTSQGEAWHPQHVAPRDWNSTALRSFFPFRALVPRRVDGLLGAGKNVGVSSIVQAAFRLHCQMLLCGQAAGALAAKSVAERCEPREVLADTSKLLALRTAFIKGRNGRPGVASIAWQDLRPDDPDFLKANIGPFPKGCRNLFYRMDFEHKKKSMNSRKENPMKNHSFIGAGAASPRTCRVAGVRLFRGDSGIILGVTPER